MEVASRRQTGTVSITSLDSNLQQSTVSQELGDTDADQYEQPEAERNMYMAMYNLPFEHLSANRGNDAYSEIQNTNYMSANNEDEACSENQNTYYITCV